MFRQPLTYNMLKSVHQELVPENDTVDFSPLLTLLKIVGSFGSLFITAVFIIEKALL